MNESGDRMVSESSTVTQPGFEGSAMTFFRVSVDNPASQMTHFMGQSIPYAF